MITPHSTSTYPPLVFVYTGNPPPQYLLENLKATSKRYPGETVLLTDRPVAIPSVVVEDISRWYSPKRFEEFCAASPLDPHFRKGFWLLAAERFFVLEQYMAKSKLEKFFHVESDVMVLDLDGYAEILDQHGSGIFAPMERERRAIASLMYVNSASALKALCDFAIKRAELGNEMKILGQFLTDRPDIGHCLPSDQVNDTERWPYTASTVSPDTGLVDATSIGMWFFGWDPRNSDSSMWNHRIQALTYYDQPSLRYHFSLRTSLLEVSGLGQPRRQIRTLHVHSKVFHRLRTNWGLWWFTLLANLPWRTVIVPKWQVVFTWLTALGLSTPAGALMSRMPAWIRWWWLAWLRPVIERAPRLMSVRQRRQLCRIIRSRGVRGTAAPFAVLVHSDDGESSSVEDTLESLTKAPYPIKHVTVLTGEGSKLELPSLGPSEWFLDTASVDEILPLTNKEDWKDSGTPQQRAEAALALYLLEAGVEDGPWLLIPAGHKAPPGATLIDNHGMQVLNLDVEKHKERNTLAAEFWSGQRVSDRWGAGSVQVIQTEWLKQMFDNSPERVREWFHHGSAPGAREISLAQCYVSWAVQQKRRHTSLTCL